MAGLYVYGITAHPIRLPASGLFRRPLRSITIGTCSVIVEDAGRAPRPTIRNLRRHSHVVATLVARGVDVLPARFGAFVSDRAELRRLVDLRRADLARALKRIKGRVQMTVRIRVPVSGRSSGTPARGVAYLRARADLARRRRRDPVVRAVERAASPFARESRLDWREGPPAIASVHHLVLRSRVTRYEDAVVRAIRSRGADAVVSGPWAPFAFAEVA